MYRIQAEIFRGGLFDMAGGSGGRSRLPEALGYLVQNPAIKQFPDTSFKLSENQCFPLLIFKDFHQILHQL